MRRPAVQLYDSAGQAVYSYRFATRLRNAAESDGVQHFTNVAYSFQNITGALGPLPEFQQGHRDMSESTGRSYVSFDRHDPNGVHGSVSNRLPGWPR